MLTEDMFNKIGGWQAVATVDILTQQYSEVWMYGYCGAATLKKRESGCLGSIELKINSTFMK